jgi:hypothetical protein
MSKDTKIRKTIRSNPFGFRIHSPFVYRLVTRGLFGKTTLTSFEISILKKLSFRERCKTLRVINFIRYIHPDRVVTLYGAGKGFPFSMTCQTATGEQGLKSQGGSIPGDCDELLVIYDVPAFRLPLSEHHVLVLANLRDPACRKLFDEMIMDTLVSVTLETRGTGFVFFDPLLQKEHYVIKSRFYLW